MTNATLRLAGLITACMIAGCSILGPTQDRTRFFTLNTLPEPGASVAQSAAVYGLGPIKLPAYLDRSEIAMRVSPTEVVYSNTDYWAEPLSATVSAVLLSNLATLLGTDRIVPYPWPVNAGVDYQIQITMLRFECDATGQCQLYSRWWITDPRDGRYLVGRDTTLTRAANGTGSAAGATALSGNLGALSQEIATALRALPAPPPRHD